jgi:hypothetical protein
MSKKRLQPSRQGSSLRRAAVASLALGTTLVVTPGVADPNDCPLPTAIDKHRLLRRLSLDLRDTAPTFEEYAAVDAEADVPDAILDAYLASDEYAKVARNYHELLWLPNLSALRLNGVMKPLSRQGPEDATTPPDENTPFDVSGRRLLYRTKGIPATEQRATCANRLQTVNAQGRPVDATGALLTGEREGYVLVHPYWDPDPTARLRVCAYDAQPALTAVVGGKTILCNSDEGMRSTACGCGPELRFCFGAIGEAKIPSRVPTPVATIYAAMREQAARISDRVSVVGPSRVPYTDVILSRTVEENGAIAFYRAYTAWTENGVVGYNEPFPAVTTTRKFYDQTWVARTDAQGAGILTSNAFLWRFQTNRGRVNRFKIAFAREHYEPSATSGACSNSSGELDLTKRCLCRDCHLRIEPLAAHWGALVEGGSAVIGNRTRYPEKRPDCVGNRSAECVKLYVTDSAQPNAGSLIALQFADAHKTGKDDYRKNLAAGPAQAAKELIESGAFARATVHNLYERLVKQELSDKDVEETLISGFIAGGYNFPALVKTIVKLPAYRRL